MSRSWRAAVVGVTLSLLLLPTAWAESPTPVEGPGDALTALPSVRVPDGLSAGERRLYVAIFGDPGAAAPRGTPLADSGFRPRPDGFSFLNYGADFRLNQRFFAQPRPLRAGARPAREVPLAPRDVRAVFGDGVCLPSPSVPPPGDCMLTEAAEQVRLDARAWGRAGHCFGMTMLAAALHSSAVSRAALGAGETNVLTPLSSRIQRAIGRFTIGGHFGIPATLDMTVDAVVSQLRAGLALGSSPLLLILTGPNGGHAVLPFAVLDRGEGRFDIAVYDPNFPGQPRAVHANATSGAWSYDGSALPSSTPLAWASSDGSTLALSSVAASLGTRSCPFCANASAARDPAAGVALVTFSPVHAENAAVFRSLRFTDASGQPLDPSLFEVLPAVDGIGDWANGPTVRMRTSAPFNVVVDGSVLRTPEPLTVTSWRAGDVKSIRIEELRAGATGVIGIRPEGRLLVRALPTRRMTVTQALDTAQASYRIRATHDAVGTVGLIDLTVRRRPLLATISAQGEGRATVPMTLELRSRTTAGSSRFRASRVLLPKRARIVISYRGWQGPSGRPAAWIDLASDGTLDEPLPLTRVGARR